MTEINLDTIVELLRTEHGIEEAYVEQTGGGIATIYAGPTREEEGYGHRYAAVAGPGTFGWARNVASTADLSDFYVGADDDGQTEPISPADVGATTEAGIARLVAAQAKKDDPSTPLDTDAVEALGFDGTGRGMTVHADERRGHIALATDGPADATLVDLGDGKLHLWSHTSVEIDPASARELAAALVAWADRQA